MPELMKVIIPIKLWCPYCGTRHIDKERNGEKWHRRAHTTHRCQGCGKDWESTLAAPVILRPNHPLMTTPMY